MLLAIDIGNTNLHLGLWSAGAWVVTWRARTVANKMGDEYAVLLRNFLRELDMDFRDIKRVVIASVVPSLTHAFSELAQRYLNLEALVVTAHVKTGIRIETESPEQVGADRIVNAAAVNALYPHEPAIVIDFGTATTFDVISQDGAYLGGAIAPGIYVALDALVSKTARLYKVELVPPPSSIGRNTSQALQSGLFLGYIGLIEGMVARLKADMGATRPVRIIATGGLATLFHQHTPIIEIVHDSLTLDGLRIIWDLNHQGEV
jgi:type III pantothenate kinase